MCKNGSEGLIGCVLMYPWAAGVLRGHWCPRVGHEAWKRTMPHGPDCRSLHFATPRQGDLASTSSLLGVGVGSGRVLLQLAWRMLLLGNAQHLSECFFCVFGRAGIVLRLLRRRMAAPGRGWRRRPAAGYGFLGKRRSSRPASGVHQQFP